MVSKPKKYTHNESDVLFLKDIINYRREVYE